MPKQEQTLSRDLCNKAILEMERELLKCNFFGVWAGGDVAHPKVAVEQAVYFEIDTQKRQT